MLEKLSDLNISLHLYLRTVKRISSSRKDLDSSSAGMLSAFMLGCDAGHPHTLILEWLTASLVKASPSPREPRAGICRRGAVTIVV